MNRSPPPPSPLATPPALDARAVAGAGSAAGGPLPHALGGGGHAPPHVSAYQGGGRAGGGSRRLGLRLGGMPARACAHGPAADLADGMDLGAAHDDVSRRYCVYPHKSNRVVADHLR